MEFSLSAEELFFGALAIVVLLVGLSMMFGGDDDDGYED